LRLVGYGLGAAVILAVTMRAASAGFPDSLNPSFKLDGVKLTLENSITSYDNFYEWGFAKEQPKELSNKGWKTEPWSIEIGGLCTNPRKIDVNDLIKLVGGIERGRRIYGNWEIQPPVAWIGVGSLPTLTHATIARG
jgi:sulfoxide reductase catalytic subunit YedY